MTSPWTIAPWTYAGAGACARARRQRDVASVLVRRGYGEPAAARGFLEGELPAHDPFLSATCAACERIRAASPPGARICVHGDYDVDGICATALAVLLLRELGADVEWHLPSRFEEGYGVCARDARRGSRTTGRARPDRRLRDHRRRGGRRGPGERGLEVIVTDHHRPGEVLPDCPIVATRPSAYPFPELCGTGVVYKLGAGAPRRRRSGRRERSLDLVALATIADVVPLVDENRALAIAGLRRSPRTQQPGLAGADEVARASIRRRSTRAPSASGSPRGSTPRAGSATRASRSSSLLTDDAERRRGSPRARGAEPRAPGGRGPDPARGGRAGRGVARGAAAAARLRRRGRGLARGRDRHRRLAARRALPPAGRPDRAARDRRWKGSGRSIPAFDLHGALAACSAHLERFGGHRAAAGSRSTEGRGVRRRLRAHADARSPTRICAPSRVDAVCRPRRSRSTSREELGAARAVRPRQPGRDAPRARCEARRRRDRRARASTFAFASAQQGPRRGRAIAFGLGAQLDRCAPVGLSTSPFGSRRTAGTAPSRRSSSSGGSSTPREGYEELRARFAELWRAASPPGRPTRGAIFAELGARRGGAARRSCSSPSVPRAARRGALPRPPRLQPSAGQRRHERVAHRRARGVARAVGAIQRRRLLMDAIRASLARSAPARAEGGRGPQYTDTMTVLDGSGIGRPRRGADRRGRGVQPGRRQRAPAPRVRLRRRSPRRARRGARARSSSTTRSASRASAPSCISTSRRSPRRSCTTSSRTPTPTSRRSAPSSATEVAQLVEGVTKLTRISFQSREQAEAENYRKMIVAMAQDVRVILIKLADRLHNMRTIEYLGKQKQVAEGEARRSRSTRRSRTGSASTRSSGSSRTSRSRRCTRASTRRSRRWSPTAAPTARSRPRRRPRSLAKSSRRPTSRPTSPGRRSTSTRSTTRWPSSGREFNEIYDLTALRVICERSGEEGRATATRALGLVALAVEADARPLQGLRRDAEAEPLPLAAHDRDRARGQAARDPGAHARDARGGRVRRSPRTGCTSADARPKTGRRVDRRG